MDRKYPTALRVLVAVVLMLSISRSPAEHATPAGTPSTREDATHTTLPDGRTLTVDLFGGHVRSGDEARVVDVPAIKPRSGHTTTVLADGRVLIFGGVDARGALVESNQWFDPATDGVSEDPQVPLLPRASHSATLLSDGDLLVAGGWNPGFGLLSEVELWNGSSNRSTLLSSENLPPRAHHDASLLADGSVLISGGYDSAGDPVRETRVYVPAQMAFFDVGAYAARATADSAPNDLADGIAGVEPQSREIASGGLIAIRFAELVDVRSLNESNVTLIGKEGNVAIAAVGAEEGRLLFVHPQRDLFPGSTYTLFVKGARTRAGLALPIVSIALKTRVLGAFGGGTVTPGKGDAESGALAQPAGAPDQSGIVDHASASPVTSPLAAAEPKAPGERFLSAGGEAAKRSTDCDSDASATGLCRPKSRIDEGVWLPGRDSVGGRWRVNGARPDAIAYTANVRTKVAQAGRSIVGKILRIDDRAVEGVDVSIGAIHARTDSDGVFVLVDPPKGRQALYVNGAPASTGDIEYGDFVMGLDVQSSGSQTLEQALYLPRVRAQDKVQLESPILQDTVIKHADIPGLEIHVPAGTVFKNWRGEVVTQIAVVPMPVDRAPVPLPANFDSYFVFEPAGLTAHGLTPAAANGIRIVYPNMGQQPPGASHEFWSYDVETGWKIYGYGKVDSASRRVVPNARVALHHGMGAGHTLAGGPIPPSPNPPPCAHQSGDPVDLSTGLFVEEFRDLTLRDVMPIEFDRAYRPGDSVDRAFGKGMTHRYGMYLYNPNAPTNYESPILVLPNGSLIRFRRIAGHEIHDGVWLHDSSSCEFYGARLTAPTNPEEYWVINLRDGRRLEFTATSGNALRAIVDKFGNRTSVSSTAGLISRVTSPAGRYINITYNAQNRISQIADNTGRSITYAYTTAAPVGLLEDVAFPDSTHEHYTYDSAGRMKTITDRRANLVLTNTYDANGRVSQQTLGDLAAYLFTYTVNGSGVVTATHVVDPIGTTRDVTFSGGGYVLTDTLAAGTALQKATTYARDAGGNVLAVVDALGRRTEYARDSAGNVTRITRLAGTANAVHYDLTYARDSNALASVTDPLNRTWTYSYTDGCLTGIRDPLGHSRTMSCNAAGQVLQVKDALNHVMATYTYNAYDLRSITDALSRTTYFTTDAAGRVVTTTDAAGNRELRAFDTNDRVTTITDPANRATQVTYDGNGNIHTITDPNGGVTEYGYNARNWRTSTKDPLLRQEFWAYDGIGHTLTYKDKKGQITAYNAAPFDALGRTSLIRYADNSTVQLQWDAADRLSGIVDSQSGTITRTYDAFDRLASEQTPQGTVSYVYDAAGQRQTMTSGSQAPVAYTFDGAGRLHRLVQGSETVLIDYDNADRRDVLTLPNGISVKYAFDDANQLTSLNYRNSANAIVGTINYGYDVTGRRNAQSGSWASDALTAANATNDFDAANEQTRNASTPLAYDLNGNLTSDGTFTYEWDARNRLKSVKQGAATKAAFTYDAFARRTTKSIDGAAAIASLYDVWDPVQEVQGSNVRPILTGITADERFARTTASGVREYFLTDAIGSTIALTNGVGDVTQRYAYEPYGVATATGSSDNPYQFSGRENDATGLYYNRARYYSTALKRFISADPLGLKGGLNMYAYVQNRPLDRVDPSGLVDVAACALGGTYVPGCGNMNASDWMPGPPPGPGDCGCTMKVFLKQVRQEVIKVGVTWVLVEILQPEIGLPAAFVWAWVKEYYEYYDIIETTVEYVECINNGGA